MSRSSALSGSGADGTSRVGRDSSFPVKRLVVKKWPTASIVCPGEVFGPAVVMADIKIKDTEVIEMLEDVGKVRDILNEATYRLAQVQQILRDAYKSSREEVGKQNMKVPHSSNRAYQLGENEELEAIGREPDAFDRETIKGKGVIRVGTEDTD